MPWQPLLKNAAEILKSKAAEQVTKGKLHKDSAVVAEVRVKRLIEDPPKPHVTNYFPGWRGSLRIDHDVPLAFGETCRLTLENGRTGEILVGYVTHHDGGKMTVDFTGTGELSPKS